MLKLSDVIAAQQRKINEMREEYDVLNQVILGPGFYSFVFL